MSLPHCVSGGESDACADFLFLHTTTIWYNNDDDNNNDDNDNNHDQSLPEGQLVHVRACFLLDVAGRLASRDVRVRPNLQNPLRIRRPYCTILDESTFLSSAATLNTPEGTKHLSTLH
jgi:hypothetical protein